MKQRVMNRFVLPLVIVALLQLQNPIGVLGDPYYHHPTTKDGGTFDFIVVGAGIGGCVVASRLAENGKHSVLLIEEGGMPHPDFAIPAISTRFASDPNYVRVINSVPQSTSAQLNDGVIQYTYGRVLGGSSSVQAMVYNRGNPSDFNEWARMIGDESWNYQNMLKYFIKAENFTGAHYSDQRGYDGPLTVSNSRYAPGRNEYLSAGLELGYPIVESNGPQSIGFAQFEYTKKFGRRVSSYNAYIEPLINSSSTAPTSYSSFNNKFANYQNHNQPKPNPNLLIMINTEAKQIIFEGNRAVGIKYRTNSTSTYYYEDGFARARKEIIVTCGAIASPILLQKSGIGTEAVLRRANIRNPVKRLPTGYGLQDHAAVFLRIIFNNSLAAFVEERDLNPTTLRMFNEFGEGPYTNYMGTAAQSFLASSALPPQERLLGWPDILLIALHAAGNSAYAVVNHELEPDELSEGEVTVQLLNILGRAKSRGTVLLNRTDPDVDPEIDFKFYSEPRDFQAMLDAIKFSVEICERTESMRRIGCRLPRAPLRECRHWRYPSDQYWECYIRQLTTSELHACGTTRMGRRDDPEAVVDSQLKVIGIEGLRVADAGVFPTVTNANIQAPIYAIAEKAAEMIMKTWQQQNQGDGNPPKNWNRNNYFYSISKNNNNDHGLINY